MSTIRPSATTRLSENALGRTLSATRRGPWRHPWFTEPMWSPKSKTWTCVVKSGFVNGHSPVVSTTAGALRESRGAFYGQIVDARSGAAEIAQAARLASSTDDYAGMDDGTRIDVPLYQRPPIGLHAWRRVARPSLYFQQRGAKPPPPSEINSMTGQVKIVQPEKGARVLRACDVIVNQPRTALSSSMNITAAGAVTGMGFVNQTLTMRGPSAGEKLRIQTGSFSELQEMDNQYKQATQLVDNYEEATWDRIKIATVYLLSPADTSEEAPVDETWTAFVQHAQFWNLAWYQPALQDVVTNTDIFRPVLGMLSVLGGGAGFLWASSVASSINDATQGAYNLLKASSLAGTFWTLTGGGSTSAWHKPTPQKPKPGMDKVANAIARARYEATVRKAEQLDPPFPYEGAKFNTALLR